MPIITAIGFDADDTLWESEIHYVNAKNEAAQLLTAYAPIEQVVADLDKIETHTTCCITATASRALRSQ
jgi:hypothetical protein